MPIIGLVDVQQPGDPSLGGHHLVEPDLVSSIADPTDRRVRLIVRTDRGDALDRRINEVMVRAEQLLRAEIGARAYDTMRAGLAAVHSEAQVRHR